MPRVPFALDWALRPEWESCVNRGARFNAEGIPWVPCGLLHKPTVTHAELEQRLALRAERTITTQQVFARIRGSRAP